MKDKFKNLYMDIAIRVSQMSSANRLKVGSIIVKEDNIISFSWNGTPSGWDNSCEDENNKTKQEVIHSEANSITKLAKTGFSAEDSTIFCTHSPCIECAKLIYMSGIKEIVYKEDYRSTDGIEFLKKCGIKVEKLP